MRARRAPKVTRTDSPTRKPRARTVSRTPTVTVMRERLRQYIDRACIARGEAQWTAGYRAATGRLKRQPCEVCGYLDVHGHHDDYDKPLQVRWLCAEHHREAHRTIDNPIGRAARLALSQQP